MNKEFWQIIVHDLDHTAWQVSKVLLQLSLIAGIAGYLPLGVDVDSASALNACNGVAASRKDFTRGYFQFAEGCSFIDLAKFASDLGYPGAGFDWANKKVKYDDIKPWDLRLDIKPGVEESLTNEVSGDIRLFGPNSEFIDKSMGEIIVLLNGAAYADGEPSGVVVEPTQPTNVVEPTPVPAATNPASEGVWIAGKFEYGPSSPDSAQPLEDEYAADNIATPRVVGMDFGKFILEICQWPAGIAIAVWIAFAMKNNKLKKAYNAGLAKAEYDAKQKKEAAERAEAAKSADNTPWDVFPTQNYSHISSQSDVEVSRGGADLDNAPQANTGTAVGHTIYVIFSDIFGHSSVGQSGDHGSGHIAGQLGPGDDGVVDAQDVTWLDD
jgi:hypothetical protein